MSTLVVVRKKGIACIGADSLTCFGAKKLPGQYDQDPDKVFSIGESWVAIAGSPAHQLVLESAVSGMEQAPSLATREEIFEFFRSLHPRFKDEYFMNPKEDDKDPYESSQMDLLIANRKGIFGVFSLREVYEFTRFWTIGSGSEYALGAIFAAYDCDLGAGQIAEIGLSAAAEFDDGTAGPFKVHTVKLDGPGTD